MPELTEQQKAKRSTLVQARGRIKARITRLSNYLTNSGLYATAKHIDEHLFKINEELTKLPSLELELMALEPDGNHADESENIMFDYEDMMVLIRKFKEPHREAASTSKFPYDAHPSSTLAYPVATDYLSSLPKAELKKFDGALENWRPYRDWFLVTIHNRHGLSEYQQFDLLKRTLTGEAEKMIRPFQTTAENYKVAWKLLESTYDNEYILLFRHCELLLETPTMKKSSAEEIRKLINHIQAQIYAMQAMGENIDGWNTMLSYIILSKLDKDTEREWNRSEKTLKVPKYEDILQFLRDQATRLTCVKTSLGSQTVSTASTSQSRPRNGGYKTHGRSSEKVQALLTSTESKVCPICKDPHTIEKCGKFLALTISDRIDIARKLHLCLNCFKNNHKTRVCKAATCTVCQKRHNHLVHLTEADLQPKISSA